MTTSTSRASLRAHACSGARSVSIRRHLSRFRPEAQSAVHALADRHQRLAELSVSFPALFAALAVPRAGFDPGPAIAQAQDGAPLPELAQEARVPLWLRRMTPETLVLPLPKLPDSLFLRRRLVNHLPRKRRNAPNWFEVVAKAAFLAHDPFALWCARLCADDARGVDVKRRLELLCLWAWFSTEPSTCTHSLIAQPWSPDIAFKTALESANAWVGAVLLHADLGNRPVADTWLRPGNVQGYDFKPLRSAEEVDAEATAMRNCVRNYGWRLANDRCRLWSVQRHGKRVATMSVGWRGQDPLPIILEVELARNGHAPPEIWLAARKWLTGQEVLHLDNRKRPRPDLDPDRSAWLSLWRPYWLAKRRFPDWLPLRPSREALTRL